MNGVVSAAEGIGLLNLIKEINNQTNHMIGGEIIIYSDNKKVINGMLAEAMKES